MHRLTLIVGLLLCLSAAAAELPSRVAEVFGSAENLRLVRAADQVDACLLRHLPAPVRPDGSVDRQAERFEETAFVPVAPAAASHLRELLLSEKTYVNADHTSSRQPTYSVRLRFRREPEVVAVDFCFPCRVLRILRNGAAVGGAGFGGNDDLIVNVFLKIFPADKVLQDVARER